MKCRLNPAAAAARKVAMVVVLVVIYTDFPVSLSLSVSQDFSSVQNSRNLQQYP